MNYNPKNIELIGKKIGMTQFFTESNELIPTTILKVGPCPILQIKEKSTDGYNAIQIGFGSKNHISNPLLGHLKKSGNNSVSHISEFRVVNINDFSLEQKLSVKNFEEGEKIDIISVSKGKGFQGVVKRWNFKGGPRSHGSMSHRRGGSYGNCQWPGEVQKGKKMPGRTGFKKCTIQNLLIIKIIEEENIIMVKGSIAGHKNSILKIRKAKKYKYNIN